MGAEIPVVAGLSGPLLRKLETAESVHGKSGLDGPTLARSPRRAEKRNFIDLYTEILTHKKEKITIVATGPQTNVATFLLTRPELKHRIESIVFMGGACFGGNWSPKAEFNIFVDPEAAQIVSGCGIPLVMCGVNPQGNDYRRRSSTHRCYRQPNRKRVSGINCFLFQEFGTGFPA